MVALCVSCHRRSSPSFWMWRCPRTHFPSSRRHHCTPQFGAWLRATKGQRDENQAPTTQVTISQQSQSSHSRLTQPLEEFPAGQGGWILNTESLGLLLDGPRLMGCLFHYCNNPLRSVHLSCLGLYNPHCPTLMSGSLENERQSPRLQTRGHPQHQPLRTGEAEDGSLKMRRNSVKVIITGHRTFVA